MKLRLVAKGAITDCLVPLGNRSRLWVCRDAPCATALNNARSSTDGRVDFRSIRPIFKELSEFEVESYALSFRVRHLAVAPRNDWYVEPLRIYDRFHRSGPGARSLSSRTAVLHQDHERFRPVSSRGRELVRRLLHLADACAGEGVAGDQGRPAYADRRADGFRQNLG